MTFSHDDDVNDDLSGSAFGHGSFPGHGANVSGDYGDGLLENGKSKNGLTLCNEIGNGAAYGYGSSSGMGLSFGITYCSRKS